MIPSAQLAFQVQVKLSAIKDDRGERQCARGNRPAPVQCGQYEVSGRPVRRGLARALTPYMVPCIKMGVLKL